MAARDETRLRGQNQRGLRDRLTFQRRRRQATLHVLPPARGGGEKIFPSDSEIFSVKYFQEPKSSALSNGGPAGGGKDGAELRGGFVLKSRSDEAPVRRRSLVERTGMKNLIQVRVFLLFTIFLSDQLWPDFL